MAKIADLIRELEFVRAGGRPTGQKTDIESIGELLGATGKAIRAPVESFQTAQAGRLELEKRHRAQQPLSALFQGQAIPEHLRPFENLPIEEAVKAAELQKTLREPGITITDLLATQLGRKPGETIGREQLAAEQKAAQAAEQKAQAEFAAKAKQQAAIAKVTPGTIAEKQKKVSGDTAKLIGITETLIPDIEELKSAFNKDYRGAITGIVSRTNRELRLTAERAADKIGRLRSGGAINDQEAASFMRQIASLADIPFGNKDSAIRTLDKLSREAITVASKANPDFGKEYQTRNFENAISEATEAIGKGASKQQIITRLNVEFPNLFAEISRRLK